MTTARQFSSVRIVPVGSALVALALALSGCGGRADPILAQAFGYQCANADPGTPSVGLCSTQPPGTGAAEVSRYCYATIADANCLDRPDADRKNQALGSSGY